MYCNTHNRCVIKATEPFNLKMIVIDLLFVAMPMYKFGCHFCIIRTNWVGTFSSQEFLAAGSQQCIVRPSTLGLYRTSLSGPEVRQIFKVRTHKKPDVLLPGRQTFITWKNGEKNPKKNPKKKTISKIFFKFFFQIFFLFIYLAWDLLTPNLCSETLSYEK